jgi:ubiquinone/menaquinone biosynthesis C-methylase UbiE
MVFVITMKIYSYLVAVFYDSFMHTLEEKILSRRRQKLLEKIGGEVLEVGSGTGANFPFYSSAARVLAIEPSEYMMKKARKKLASALYPADIRLLRAGVEDKSIEEHLPATGFDAIVCTLVLCTIPDPEAALKKFRQWLKPGGRLYVLEHIHSRQHPSKFLQKLFNPAWKCVAEGCNLTRHTDRLIKEAGFEIIEEEYFKTGLQFYIGVAF